MQKIMMLLAFVFLGFGMFAQVQRKVAGTNDTYQTAVNDEKETNEGFDKKPNKRQILKELNLTREQKSRLKEIQQDNKSKRDEIMNDGSLTKDQKQDKLKEIRRAEVYDLQGILSDEQKARLKAIRKERRKNSSKGETGND
jgi:hypothetical protein